MNEAGKDTVSARKAARKAARAGQGKGGGRGEVSDALVRENGLGHLLRGQSPMPRSLHRTALDIHHLWLAARGDAGGIDWMQERVDGGGLRLDFDLAGALDADRALRRLIQDSEMGREAAECLLAICGEGATVTGYAVELEQDAEARRNGGCSRATLDRVRWLLRTGLERARKVGRLGGSESASGPVRERVCGWLDADARPQAEATKLGSRSDLVRADGLVARRA